MPRNGSGTYTLPQAAFVPGTTISSAAVNSDFSDIATALTDSLAADGQTTMTGAIKAASGTAASPSITFGSNTNQGFYNVGAGTIGVSVGGTLVGEITSQGFCSSAGAPLGGFVQNYLTALTLSNDSVTPNSVLDIASGQCSDSTNTVNITLAAFTKSTAGNWSAGSGNFGMGNGLTVTTSTWYHVFAIINTGVADIYFDTSVTAANAPTGTTAFRRIGSFKTDGSSHIIAFTQFGDEFLWKTPLLDVNGTNPAAGQTLETITTPLGINTYARIYMQVDYASTSDAIGAYAPDIGNQAANSWITTSTSLFVTTNGRNNTTWAEIRTNTSSQIAVASTSGNAELFITTMGWRDNRGKG